VAAYFKDIRKKHAANSKCFDCGTPMSVEWASVSFGIFLCIECSSLHRRMGTDISRIRGCKMDSWAERQLQVFERGGNARLAEFFAANGVPKDAGCYRTPAAQWYRDAWIKCSVLGLEVPPPPAGVSPGPCVSCTPGPAPEAVAGPEHVVDLLDLLADSPSSPAAADPYRIEASRDLSADLLSFSEEAPFDPDAGATSGARPLAISDDLFNLEILEATPIASGAVAELGQGLGVRLDQFAPTAGGSMAGCSAATAIGTPSVAAVAHRPPLQVQPLCAVTCLPPAAVPTANAYLQPEPGMSSSFAPVAATEQPVAAKGSTPEAWQIGDSRTGLPSQKLLEPRAIDVKSVSPKAGVLPGTAWGAAGAGIVQASATAAGGNKAGCTADDDNPLALAMAKWQF
jgi:hypothetical protein